MSAGDLPADGNVGERSGRAQIRRPRVLSGPEAKKGRRLIHAALSLYLLMAAAGSVTFAHAMHGRSGNRVVASASPEAARAVPRYLVLMVLDGGRPGYFGLTSLPHVDALRARGTQYTNAIAGILEAETPAGHATISTGSRPSRSGILGFDWANDNDRYSLFSPNKMGALEQILQGAHAPTLAGLYKKRFPRATVVALSGHKYYAAAPLGGPAADAILYYKGNSHGQLVPVAVPGHVPPPDVLTAPGVIAPTTRNVAGVEDNLVTSLALAAFARMRARLLLINYPEFDWPLGHVYGGNLDRARVIVDMKQFDADLGSIEAAYARAGILNQTLFVITSDHGMMPIRHLVPASIIHKAIADAGTRAPDIASNTADYIWLADRSKSQKVATNIVAAHVSAIQSVYYLDTATAAHHYVYAGGRVLAPVKEQANQYLLDALLNGHEPAVVAFGREGTSFSSPAIRWQADHGGNSWQSQHVPLILAGPGIRVGAVRKVAELQDVAPTVLADMGVSPAGMTGQILADALLHPPPGTVRTRADEVTRLKAVIQGLRMPVEKTAGGS